jgi:hypothetical protein
MSILQKHKPIRGTVMTEAKRVEPCVVCQRIPPKIVFHYAHRIFDKSTLTRDEIHHLALEACATINYADGKSRMFFCGKTQIGILSGLFYLLAMNAGYHSTIEDLRKTLPRAHSKAKERWDNLFYNVGPGPLNAVTVSQSYQSWLRTFPECFPHLDKWKCKCGTWNKMEDWCCSKCRELAERRQLFP